MSNNILDISEKLEEKKKTLQVYECGKCQAQDYILGEQGCIFCSKCFTTSAAMWFRAKVVIDDKECRSPKERKFRSEEMEGLTGYVCGYCNGTTFHMLESGNLSCFRCRKINSIQFQFPEPVKM